ncbi:MAG: SusC/RagA family TonB-linked outer membrane protein [Rikenellaceae bacterium]|nr:SusC/RagA family TonB-linked outer membrane protein [Rikenellaceae bacterium]
MRLKKHIAYIIFFVALVLPVRRLYGQGNALKVLSGTVTDETGTPLSGALVRSADGKNEITTGRDGSYTLRVAARSSHIVVSFPGYCDRMVPAEAADAVSVRLEPDITGADMVIDMGYTRQTRNSLTGAVSSVKGEELEKFPVANLSQALVGNFTGLTSMEVYSELSSASVWTVIRGNSTINGRDPVVVIDGVICPNTNFDYITSQEIESISILKDASATALYGIQGANGIISIRTKRGHAGPTRVGVYFNQSLQQMTRRPKYINSARYAELRNEAGYNDGRGAYSQFSQQQVEGYRSVADRQLYPDNDYYGMFMRDFANMQQAGVNVTGGDEKVKYYSNVNFMYQHIPFKIAEKDKFDPTPSNYFVNFRSNVDVKINSFIDGFMSLSGNIRNMKTAGETNTSVYSHIFNLPPTMYGPLTPYEEDPEYPDRMIGGQVITHEKEPNLIYGVLNRSGYIKNLHTHILAQAGLNFDLGMVTPGLSLKGLIAYQTESLNSTSTLQNYERWIRTSDTGKLEFMKYGTENNTPLVYNKNKNFAYNSNFFASADYHRRFGLHGVDATGYFYHLDQDKGSWTSTAGMLLYKRQSLGVTATYSYAEKLFLKGDLGYSGSDQFHPDHRFITTPAVSAAWVLSKEPFMASANWLDYLKIRASYGVSANDQLGFDQRFLYIDDFRAENSYDGLRGNPDLTAEKMKKQNYGLDISLLGRFSVSFDYYRDKVSNMLIDPTGVIPEYQGILLSNYAKTNEGVMKNSGVEIAFSYMERIGRDWTVFATLNFSTNKNTVVDIKEAANPDSYAYRYRNTGYSLHQPFGYIIDKSNGNGYFNSQEELDNSGLTYSFGTPRMGDFVYKDLNGDGVIDEKDQAPIGYTWLPRQTYSLTGGFSYRNWEISLMFQGVAKAHSYASGIGLFENLNEGVFNDIHLNAWTADRYAAGDKITYPALSLESTTNHVSNSYFVMNRSYLRLRNVEVAYTLPISSSGLFPAEKVRFALRGQNLFTVDKMKSKYIDPETGVLNAFQPYRVYSLGISLVF